MAQPNEENYHPNDIIPSLEGEPLPFRHEGFYMLDETGTRREVGCELLLNIPNPREYLDSKTLPKEEILQRKEKALRDGIAEAKRLSDKEMVTVNIDGDWATFNNVTRFFEDPNNTLPDNTLVELTEVERIGDKAAEALVSVALQHKMLLFDDMPTDQSMGNMETMFSIMKKLDQLHYGVKIDFKITHALLRRLPFGKNKIEDLTAEERAAMEEKYLQAENSLRNLKALIDTSEVLPTWIVFEGLTYEDELISVTNMYSKMLHPGEDSNRAIVLGQFYQDKILSR